MHTPTHAPDVEPGPHDSPRVTPQPPVAPEMIPTISPLDPDDPHEADHNETPLP